MEDTEELTEMEIADKEIELILALSRVGIEAHEALIKERMEIWERWYPTLRSASRLRTICDELCIIVDQLLPDAELPQSTRDNIAKSIVSTLRLLARVDELTEEAKSKEVAAT